MSSTRYWRIWIRDSRTRPQTRTWVRGRVNALFVDRGFRIDSGPMTIFNLRGDLPGEWSYDLADPASHEPNVVRLLVHEALISCQFKLRQNPQELTSAAGEARVLPLRRVR